MHIINLTIKCKNATGDGTKIVCMNSDYEVHITASDCGTFTNAPVKRLVVRHDREYQEIPITASTEGGKSILKATLPAVENNEYVDLGVCGKETEDADPVYTSTSARYDCIKSILNGVVVRKSNPILTSKDITANGEYRAVDEGSDGYNIVNVQVLGKLEEERTAMLSMANGDQVIHPTDERHIISSAVIKKPATLIPENIKKDVEIGGIIGEYEEKLIDLVVKQDGEFSPPAGYVGFSKIIVAVLDSVTEKKMAVGDTFEYLYTSPSPRVTMDTPNIVGCYDDGDGINITALSEGICTVTIEDAYSDGTPAVVNFAITVYDTLTLKIEKSGTYDVGHHTQVEVDAGAKARIENGVLYIG